MLSCIKPDFKFTVSLLTIFLLPNFIYVVLHQDSLATGLLIASFIVILINVNNVLKFETTLSKLIIYIFIIVLLVMTTSFVYIVHDISKPFLSLTALLLIFASASVFSISVKKLSGKALESSILFVIIILLALGWIKIFIPITIGPYSSISKPVFPFIEESFYALSIGLFSVGYSVTARIKNVLFIIGNLFLFSILFPNLTMLVSATLTLFISTIRLRPKYFRTILFVLPIVIIVSLDMLVATNPYFANRLSFANSSNLTTLVFLQGWALAYENLIHTHGIGLGFQMLGMPGTHLTQFSEPIEIITKSTSNLTDGGLLAAKIIAEFGIIGLIISLLYVVHLFKFVFRSNMNRYLIYNKNNTLILKYCLLNGLLLGYITEYFFRGYGYFSPGLYLIIAIILSTYKTDILGKTFCR